MTAQVISREKLGPLTKIGQGGQGVVYGAPNVKTKFAASMVYKEYKSQTLAEIDFTALAAMPALVEDSLSYAQAERLISMAAWPCALVDDAGTPTGFVMPAIPDQFFVPLATVKGVSLITAEFQHLLNHSSVLAARGIKIDDAQRYTLLREVASGLSFLHNHGVCVGDISPKNLLFSLTPREAVYFIDCDAMRINGVSALPQMETPGWDTPAGEELATIYSDTYKLGLLALRLLAGDQDTKNPHHIPPTTPGLLRQIITDTLKPEPHNRPLPEAWNYVLGHAIEQAQHQKTTATAAVAPTSAAPELPPIPVVHSRPPARTADSRPPVPVAPSRPPVAAPPPPTTPAPSKTLVWVGVGLVGVILASVIVFLVALANSGNAPPSSAPVSPLPQQPTYPSYSSPAPTYPSPTPTYSSPTPAPAPAYTPPAAPVPTTTPPPPDTYVAVASAPSGRWATTSNASTLGAAKDSAMSLCSKYATGCEILASNENGCVALVSGNGHHQGGTGASRNEAEQDALRLNGGGQVTVSVCSWERSH